METKLKIEKQDLNASPITEEHSLFFGKVFRGKSAYQYAVNSGLFSGTEAEFERYVGNIGNLSLNTQMAANLAESAANKANEAGEQAKKAATNANEAAQRANDASVRAVNIATEKGNEAISIASRLYTPITYIELRMLHDAGQLVPGRFYRIIDYQTMTSQENTRSAGHQFDIIVQAIDEHTLSEEACAIQHDGDTYFSNSNLSLWRLKYTLDNNGFWKWAVADILEVPQEWKSPWGVLESKRNAEGSTNYEKVLIGGKAKYLYAPANRGNYWDTLVGTLFREEKIGEASSPSQLSYKSYGAPYEEGDEENGYYWYWGDVSYIDVYANSNLVATLYHNDNGVFYDENDMDYEYPISFDPNTNYEDTEDGTIFLYTPSSGAEAWFENVIGGKVDIVEKVYYDGLTDSLFYVFDSLLPQASINIKNVYSKKDGCIYQSDTYLGDVTYTAYVPYVYNGGKGVIYEMVDENENCIQFDFKNIQFYDQVTDKWYYTFGETVDNSLSKNSTVHHNSFVRRQYSSGEQPHANFLFPIIIVGTNTYNNYIAISAPAVNSMIIHRGNNQNFNNNNIRLSTLNGRVAFNAQVMFNTIYGSFSDIDFDGITYTRLRGLSMRGTLLSTISKCNISLTAPIVLKCSLYDVKLIGGGNFSVVNGSGNALPLYNSKIDLGALGSQVTIRYNNTNTISSSTPLSSLDICIPNNSKTEHNVDISGFPLSSPYTLHIATNSSGVVKQWCDADLVQ